MITENLTVSHQEQEQFYVCDSVKDLGNTFLGQCGWCLGLFVPKEMPGGPDMPLAPQGIPAEFRSVQGGYLTPLTSSFVMSLLPQNAARWFTTFHRNNSFQRPVASTGHLAPSKQPPGSGWFLLHFRDLTPKVNFFLEKLAVSSTLMMKFVFISNSCNGNRETVLNVSWRMLLFPRLCFHIAALCPVQRHELGREARLCKGKDGSAAEL